MTSNRGSADLSPSGGKRVLVTGAAGFVGRHLTRLLAQTDMTVLRAGRAGEDVDIAFDLADTDAVARAVEEARPDVIFHLAGEASVAAAAHAAARTWAVNLGGSLALASAIADVAPHATLLFTSSCEVYGDAFLEGTVSEATRPAPNSVYGQSKLAAEQMLAAVLPTTATLIIARPSNHIGPGQHPRFAIPSFASQLAAAEAAGQSATIRVGNLSAERDFMDVRDVVRAYLDLAGRYGGSGVRETFNIASGEVRSLAALLDILRAKATVGSDVEIDPSRLRPNDIPCASIDADRLRREIGWRPGCSLDQSLADVLAAARAA